MLFVSGPLLKLDPLRLRLFEETRAMLETLHMRTFAEGTEDSPSKFVA